MAGTASRSPLETKAPRRSRGLYIDLNYGPPVRDMALVPIVGPLNCK